MTVDPRLQPVQDNLSTSYMARTTDREIAYLQLAMTELVKVVETLLPEPDPEPGVDAQPLLDQIDNEIRGETNAQPRAWWQAQGRGSTVGVVDKAIRFHRATGGDSDPRLVALRLQHNAAMDSKNDLIRELEARIANQRKELDHLNSERSLRNKELEARIEELEVLTKAPATAINQLREELTGQLLGYFQKSA